MNKLKKRNVTKPTKIQKRIFRSFLKKFPDKVNKLKDIIKEDLFERSPIKIVKKNLLTNRESYVEK